MSDAIIANETSALQVGTYPGGCGTVESLLPAASRAILLVDALTEVVMAIQSFEFSNRRRGWSLQRMSFGALNLLVGHSGVGKTRIIDALYQVRKAATPKADDVPSGCRWTIDVTTQGCVYRWEVETGANSGDDSGLLDDESDSSRFGDQSRSRATFLSERILRDGQLLVERDQENFTFEDKALPKLSTDESAVVLLREDAAIQPLHAALHRCMFRHAGWARENVIFASPPGRLAAEVERLTSLDELRGRTKLPLLQRAYLMSKVAPDAFQELVAQYQDIFPMVRSLTVAPIRELDAEFEAVFDGDFYALGIKEQGADDWIVGPSISSGMVKTFNLLLDLMLAPNDSVVLVDEFENSLGVNCLAAVTEALGDRVGDIQFVLTSHHPYIIENIPTKHWKVVTRSAGKVTVLDADQVPALTTRSSQSAFFQLLNSAEYEHGIGQ